MEDDTLSLSTMDDEHSVNDDDTDAGHHEDGRKQGRIHGMMNGSQEYAEEDLTSLLDSSDGGGSEVYQLRECYEPPKAKWVWTFPPHLERKLKHFDDPIIQQCQRLSGPIWKIFSLSITACVAIEFGIAVPYLLFFLGYDGIATELAYLGLILAIISQIPKRFVWRLRPYMAGRAKLIKKDTTSSFPSRAVTCGTVYAFGLIWAYMYIYTFDESSLIFRWWMPILFIVAVILTSFARINLGVHYPSDCVAGLVQGVIVCMIGTGLWRTDILGCESCHDKRCYATNTSTQISMHASVHLINWWMVVAVVAFLLGVPILSVMKPIDFWSKCDRVYAMLLPGIAFQLILLCPHSTHEGYALRSPPPFQWYALVFGVFLVTAATIIGGKFGGKRPLLMYTVEFLVLSAALFFWRLNWM